MYNISLYRKTKKFFKSPKKFFADAKVYHTLNNFLSKEKFISLFKINKLQNKDIVLLKLDSNWDDNTKKNCRTFWFFIMEM